MTVSQFAIAKLRSDDLPERRERPFAISMIRNTPVDTANGVAVYAS